MRSLRSRFSGLTVKRSGAAVAKFEAIFLVKALSSAQSTSRFSGATTCKPLPPVVLQKDSIFIAAR